MRRTRRVPVIIWVRVRHDDMAYFVDKDKGVIKNISRGPKTFQSATRRSTAYGARQNNTPPCDSLAIQDRQSGALSSVGRVLQTRLESRKLEERHLR